VKLSREVETRVSVFEPGRGGVMAATAVPVARSPARILIDDAAR
jgi:hypothetical protein